MHDQLNAQLLYETFFLQESNSVFNVTAHDHNEPNTNIESTRHLLIDFFEFSINTSSGDTNCSFQNRSIRHKPPHCDDAYIELNISYRLSTCPSVCETAILVTHSPEQVILY